MIVERPDARALGAWISTRSRPTTVRWAAMWPSTVVLLAAMVATGWVTTLLWRRIDALSSAAYDLGFFQQVLWNVGTSGAWTSSFHEGSFLGLHFSPILVLPAFLQRVVGFDPHVLSLLHAIGVGGLVISGFLFLRAAWRPSPWAGVVAAILAIGIPLWPAIQWVVRADFHPELFGVVLALLAGWAGLTARPSLMWVCAGIAVLTREDVAYAMVVVGLAVATLGTGRMRRHGRALAAVAAVVGLVVFLIAMPWLRDGAPSDTARYYAWLGTGADILVAPILLGDRILGALARPEPWLVLGGMLVGLGGLPLLRPRWLLPVAPPFLALILSDHAPQAAIIGHYPLSLVVPLMVAAGIGGRRALAIAARWRRHAPRVARVAAVGVAAAMVLAGVVVARLAGPLPPFADPLPASLTRTGGIEDLRAIVGLVPGDAPLVADEGLIAPLAARPRIGRLTDAGFPVPDAFVVVDRDAWHPSALSARRHEHMRTWLDLSARPVIADDGRFIVWGPLPAGPP